jgi:3,4-dihydroxy-2-butanone 4-phosphate synthase
MLEIADVGFILKGVFMTRALPTQPNFEHLKKQAKDLLTQIKVSSSKAKLSDAQFVLAQEYGFASWPKLKHFVTSQDQKPLPESLRRALNDLQNGKMCILFDDEKRENEGDLVLAANKVSAEAINFMTKFARGTVCLALKERRVQELGLRLVNPERRSLAEPAFLSSIDASGGITTGVSAFDRAETIRRAVASGANSQSVHSPGHIFPLQAHSGGVRERKGHTELSLELMRLAGLGDAAVICEILNEDGTMARFPDLQNVSNKHGLALVHSSDLLLHC